MGGTNPAGEQQGPSVKAGDNLAGQKIVIKLDDGTAFDMGDNNKLSSVTYTGGDTGGGNVTVTYSYSNFNSLTVTDPLGTGANWFCDGTVN